jgi:TRAP-type C4-dicarboxylate transport system permease large subunit
MSRGFDMARSMSGRRLGGLLAFLMSGLLFLGAVSASAVGDEELGPAVGRLATTPPRRLRG